MGSPSNPVERALWYVESHFTTDISLDDVAAVGGVSRFHLVRAFGATFGKSVMRYARGRRLSDAARALAAGAPDILAVALDAGYGSHEAFTRAFRDEFGVTPEQVRANGRTDNLALTDSIKMSETEIPLAPPHFVDGRPLLIVGMSERYGDRTSAGIPAQWQRFAPHIGNIAGEIQAATYGILCNRDDDANFDYVCAVEVHDFFDVPSGLVRMRIAAQRYAVFSIPDHVSNIRRAWASIWNTWLPSSGHNAADAPELERYGRSFDPITGAGGFEMLVPLRR